MERRLSLLAIRLGEDGEPRRFTTHTEAFQWLFEQDFPLPPNSLMQRLVFSRHAKSVGTNYRLVNLSKLERLIVGGYTFDDIVESSKKAMSIQLKETVTTESVLDNYIERLLVMNLTLDDTPTKQ